MPRRRLSRGLMMLISRFEDAVRWDARTSDPKSEQEYKEARDALLTELDELERHRPRSKSNG